MTDSFQNTITFALICDECGKRVVAHKTSEFALQSCKALRNYGWSHMEAGLSLSDEISCRPQSWDRTVNGTYATENDL